MNRELIFRAWHKKYKYMAYVQSIDWSFNGSVNLSGADICGFDEVELMQFTGLPAIKSYRGTKPEDLRIFEGDICKTQSGNAVVVFDEDDGAWEYEFNLPDGTCWSHRMYSWGGEEIIGNIHEHKELLEKQK